MLQFTEVPMLPTPRSAALLVCLSLPSVAGTINYGSASFSGYGTAGASATPSGNSLLVSMPNFSVGTSQTGSATMTDPVTQDGSLTGFNYDFSSFTGPGTGCVTLKDGFAGDQLMFCMPSQSPTGFWPTPHAGLSFTVEVDLKLTDPPPSTSLESFSVTAESPEPSTGFLIVPAAALACAWLLARRSRKSRQN